MQGTETVDPTAPSASEAGDGDPGSGAHIRPSQYVLVAVVLAIVTGVEVAISYAKSVNSNLVILALVALAAVKFFLVAAWYMHLRFDRPIFRGLFLLGLAMAMFVYLVVLLSFSVFTH